MLDGFTKEELEEFAKECQERFTNLELGIMRSVLIGEICTYKRLFNELESLNRRYEDEMDDYILGIAPDIIDCVIGDFKRYEDNDKSLVSAVKDWLDIYRIVDKCTKRLVYMNDDGLICDEHGVPLTSDGERRVFEIIRGSKADNEPVDGAPAVSFKVTKGGRAKD